MRFELTSPEMEDKSMPSNAIGLLLGGSSSPFLALGISVLRWEGFWVERGIATLVEAVPEGVPCISRGPRHLGVSGGKVETPAGELRANATPSSTRGRAISISTRSAACLLGGIGDCAPSTMWRCLACGGQRKSGAYLQKGTTLSAQTARPYFLLFFVLTRLQKASANVSCVAGLSRVARSPVTAEVSFPRGYAACPDDCPLVCAPVWCVTYFAKVQSRSVGRSVGGCRGGKQHRRSRRVVRCGAVQSGAGCVSCAKDALSQRSRESNGHGWRAQIISPLPWDTRVRRCKEGAVRAKAFSQL